MPAFANERSVIIGLGSVEENPLGPTNCRSHILISVQQTEGNHLHNTDG